MTDDEAPETVDERPQRAVRAAEDKLDGGRYRLGALLGRGGMGEVIEAHDNEMGRAVAIKRLLMDAPASQDIERFLREARVQGRLDHPAIPPVYELASDASGRPFFVMKRLAGTTLSDILLGPETPKFTRQRLLRAFAEVCNAVELAHTRGVIHRDLKPSNIMLGDFGEVYVLDWGVAKVSGDREIPSLRMMDGALVTTTPGAVIGTRPYMAPEQLAGKDIDHRVDVFALGCVLFEILTGERLYKREATASPPVSRRPSERAPERGIPPELDEICIAATEPSLDARTNSATELGNAVQRFLDGDRDLALRAELANAHLDRARAAMDEAVGERAQRIAMQEAARALALDPHLDAAADIITRVVLQPPSETPPEVRELMREDATKAIVAHERTAMLGFVCYVLFAIAMLLTDVREPRYVTALVAIAVFTLVSSAVLIRLQRYVARVAVSLLCTAALTALVSRMFSPLLVAPAVAAVTAFMFTRNPLLRRRRRFVPVVMFAAALGPLVLEQLHWISATYHASGGVITIAAPALPVNVNVAAMEIAFTCAIVLIATMVSRSYMKSELALRTAVHVQAWRLRQLVPKASAQVRAPAA